jgi:hypothetical protein
MCFSGMAANVTTMMWPRPRTGLMYKRLVTAAPEGTADLSFLYCRQHFPSFAYPHSKLYDARPPIAHLSLKHMIENQVHIFVGAVLLNQYNEVGFRFCTGALTKSRGPPLMPE